MLAPQLTKPRSAAAATIRTDGNSWPSANAIMRFIVPAESVLIRASAIGSFTDSFCVRLLSIAHAAQAPARSSTPTTVACEGASRSTVSVAPPRMMTAAAMASRRARYSRKEDGDGDRERRLEIEQERSCDARHLPQTVQHQHRSDHPAADRDRGGVGPVLFAQRRLVVRSTAPHEQQTDSRAEVQQRRKHLRRGLAEEQLRHRCARAKQRRCAEAEERAAHPAALRDWLEGHGSPYFSSLSSEYSPFVFRVSVRSSLPRLRQNQPCEPSKAATSSPPSDATPAPFA